MYCTNCGDEASDENQICHKRGIKNIRNIIQAQTKKNSSDTVIEHLKITKTLETRVYELEQIINNLHNKIEKLGTIPEVECPDYDDIFNHISCGTIFLYLLYLGGVMIFLHNAGISLESYGFIQYIRLIIYILIAALPITAISIYVYKNNLGKRREYESAIVLHNIQRRINNKKIAVLENEIEDLNETKNETANYLKRIYSADIIVPKYRNMIAVITIYGYFAAGRCSELTGCEGAYNIYENELRQNLIINSLQNIMQNLNQIKRNQYMLYKAIEQTQRAIEDMSYAFDELASNVNSIGANSKISSYNSKIAAENSSFITYMNVMNL